MVLVQEAQVGSQALLDAIPVNKCRLKKRRFDGSVRYKPEIPCETPLSVPQFCVWRDF